MNRELEVKVSGDFGPFSFFFLLLGAFGLFISCFVVVGTEASFSLPKVDYRVYSPFALMLFQVPM